MDPLDTAILLDLRVKFSLAIDTIVEFGFS